VTKRGIIVAVITAVVLLVVVISTTFWFLEQTLPGVEDLEPESSAVMPDMAAEPAGSDSMTEEGLTEGSIKVTLYYLSGSGIAFSTEEREITFSSSLQEQARRVVRQLLAGSRQGRGSAFPAGVQLRDIFITPQGLAFVDLSQELIANHPGGTCAEELTIYSLTNTLITNFPAVKKVQILVEGREIQSLAGHLDLSKPYGRGPSRLEQS
jgi:spore germination protein GerM